MGDGLLDEVVRLVDVGQRLLQVDDVDAVALGEDEALHLRVPAPGLMPEVDTALEQLLHGDDGHAAHLSRAHARSATRFFAGSRLAVTPGAPSAEPAHERDRAAVLAKAARGARDVSPANRCGGQSYGGPHGHVLPLQAVVEAQRVADGRLAGGGGSSRSECRKDAERTHDHSFCGKESPAVHRFIPLGPNCGVVGGESTDWSGVVHCGRR